jgi:hypothetical protein
MINRWLGLTVPCVNALIERGELPSLRDPDGSVRISAAALIGRAYRDTVASRLPRRDASRCVSKGACAQRPCVRPSLRALCL